MINRLERLEGDLESMRSSIFTIRGEEFKRLVLKEVQGVFEEYSEREVMDRIGCMDDILHCSKRRFCMSATTSNVEAASLAFLKGDLDRTFTILSNLENNARTGKEECEAGECHDYVLSMISEIKTVFTLAGRIVTRVQDLSLGVQTFEGLDPESVADTLIPLAHPIRIAILVDLGKRDMTFSELSRDLDLRTGHLQFHLKALEDGGYVRKERARGRYGISLKGMTALDGLRAFMASLVKMN